jgi:hypothetical protein
MLSNRTPGAVASDLLWAKAQEEKCKQERIALEEELLYLIGDSEDGTQTHLVENFRIKVIAKVSRSVDPDMWAVVTDGLSVTELPDEMNPVTIEEKYKVSSKLCRELKRYKPDLFATLSRAITTKNQKSTITIEKMGDSNGG